MDVLDFLINNDISIDKLIKHVKIQRLSDIANKDIEFKVRAVNYIEYKSATNCGSNYECKLQICCYGLLEPDLYNKKLQDKFHAENAQDLLSVILTDDELDNLYMEICKLSGFYKEVAVIERK